MANPFLKTARHGTIAYEAAVALVFAAAILTSVAQFLAFSAGQLRSRDQRLTATREASDLMEQLMAQSWQQLTPDALEALELSESCRTKLPDAQLRISVRENEGEKQLNIEIDWRQASGNREAPVRLVAWKYDRQEATE